MIHIVKDYTGTPYTTRSGKHDYITWYSEWDDNLKLIRILYGYNTDDVEKMKDYTNISKDEHDFGRTRKAIGRHLTKLKKRLGMEIKVKKEKEKKIYILRPYYDGPFTFAELEEGVKTWNSHRLSHVLHVEATKEKALLAKEYNEALEKFIKYREEVFKKIKE